MAIDKEEYRKAWEVMMRNKFASTFLQIIRQIVACSPSDNAAENIIRFHAHQLATFGTTNCNDVTSLAQRQVAKVLNHIIMYIIKDNEI